LKFFYSPSVASNNSPLTSVTSSIAITFSSPNGTSHDDPRTSPPPSPQKTPKICPPTPSPLRSQSRPPFVKRLRTGPLPMANLFSDIREDSKPEKQNDELTEIISGNSYIGNTWEISNEFPKITCSSPPCTPPSSPPQIEYNSYNLHPPPCNINPFSPEKPRQKDLSNHDEYSPVVPTNHFFSRYNHDYEELEKIGSGCFGSVFKCRNRIDGWDYAIKISKKKFHGPGEKKKNVTRSMGLGRFRNT